MGDFRASWLFPEPGTPEASSLRGRHGPGHGYRQQLPRSLDEVLRDMVVCGYESKRYRDDDTARAVEEGRMLIPWNGDDSLRVDRYDVRNLTDDSQKLARFRGVYRRSPQQVELHRKLETERYRDLVEATATGAAAAAAAAEVVEEEAREELRRVDEKRRGDAMFFQLDYSTLSPAPPPPPQPPTIYIPRFAVPDNIQLPQTEKQSAIIEKTAKFFDSNKDPQTALLVRAKQAHNPLFRFLEPADELHPFYRHVCYLVSSGMLDYTDGDDIDGDDDEDAHKVPDQTSSKEPLQPPPEAVSIIDKVAEYVARNGSEFEATVAQKNRGNEKFFFLKPDHAHNEYYREKLRQLQGGKPSSSVLPGSSDDLLEERRKRADAFLRSKSMATNDNVLEERRRRAQAILEAKRQSSSVNEPDAKRFKTM